MSPHARSILFPALASGNGTYDFEKSVDHIAKTLMSRAPACIQEAWIMVKDRRKEKPAHRVLEARLGEIKVIYGSEL